MSSDETQLALARAHELVEAGQYADARAILDPILAAEPNNADAWWVYAHSVTSAEEGRNALENVVRIDPRYPGASELLAQARSLAPAVPDFSTTPAPPVSIPEEALEEPEDFDSEFEDVAETRQRRAAQPAQQKGGVPMLPIALGLAGLVVIALLVLPNLLPAPSPTPEDATNVAAVPTESANAAATDEAEATRRPTITPTVEGATAEASSGSGDFTAVAEALSAFPLASAGIAPRETSLGNTLVASVCSAPGREMRMLLPQVMNAFAAQSPSLDAAVQAIGVSLVNCETNTPMLTVASEIITAQSYAGGDLSDAEFAASWRPQ